MTSILIYRSGFIFFFSLLLFPLASKIEAREMEEKMGEGIIVGAVVAQTETLIVQFLKKQLIMKREWGEKIQLLVSCHVFNPNCITFHTWLHNYQS